jgi:hypothetical protein
MNMMKRLGCVLGVVIAMGPLTAMSYTITAENALGSVLSGNKQLNKAGMQWEVAQEKGIEARDVGGRYLLAETAEEAVNKLRAKGFATNPSKARLQAWKDFYADLALPNEPAAPILVYGIPYGSSGNHILGKISAVFPPVNRANNGFVMENNGQRSLRPLYKVNARKLLRDYHLGKFKEIANFGSRVSFTIRGNVYRIDDSRLRAVLEKATNQDRFLLTLTDAPHLPVPTAFRNTVR